METASNIIAVASTRKGRRVVYLLLALAAAGSAIVVVTMSAVLAAPQAKDAAPMRPSPAAPRRAATSRETAGRGAPPDAAEFARGLAATTRAYAVAHGAAARIVDVHCVEASSGHYMCSYAVIRPHRAAECHLMQAIWTPERASTYTVTLAGRVARCATLRQAIRSLR